MYASKRISDSGARGRRCGRDTRMECRVEKPKEAKIKVGAKKKSEKNFLFIGAEPTTRTSEKNTYELNNKKLEVGQLFTLRLCQTHTSKLLRTMS